MDKAEALRLLTSHREEIRRDFGVTRLALFGSTARDEAREDSDVDMLVRFEGGATLRRYMGLSRYLETLLRRRVDLVTEPSLRAELRSRVERELVDVPLVAPVLWRPAGFLPADRSVHPGHGPRCI